MADDYKLAVRITVFKGEKEDVLVQEETTFGPLSFGKMTQNAADYYDLITKLRK